MFSSLVPISHEAWSGTGGFWQVDVGFFDITAPWWIFWGRHQVDACSQTAEDCLGKTVRWILGDFLRCGSVFQLTILTIPDTPASG